MNSSTPVRIAATSDSSPGGSVSNYGSVNVSSSTSALGGYSTTTHAMSSSVPTTSYMGSSSVAGTTPPNSAGLKYPADEKSSRKPQLQIMLPKLPSTDSLNNSPGPSSPGLTNWADSSSKFDGNSTDKSPADTSKLNRKESYKAQRKNYRREKKRVASELFSSLEDPSVIFLTDWLKVRGTLKSWTKLWCVLKPGLLLLYKSTKTKSSHWVGTILITSCQVIERPSKKDGFCFKLFHPMEQSIWAPRGPDKETMGAVVQPLPTAYLIFRAPSQAAGKCWMDALELSLRCSALLLRPNSTCGTNYGLESNVSGQISHETQWSEADYEKHFDTHDLDAAQENDSLNEDDQPSCPESESEPDGGGGANQTDLDYKETPYVHMAENEFGAAGEQIEELGEENKSLIWFLMKQVRPGMDLSKVVLPTFVLEPRSFLDKLADSYYHADFLSRAVAENDPFERMKSVVLWYMSGFYKKPKGLKKPYNPIIGETFRCFWDHPDGSRTFYIAEQVSHHPPISAFYVTNRKSGFSISCSILAKSKFYGNSTSAVLEGVATLTLLPRGEIYTLTTPYAHCKGFLMGTLSMELGGKVNIECENTGYKTEIEFKLRSFLSGSDSTNMINGKIKLGKETHATLSGYWDREIRIKDSKSGEESTLFHATKEMKDQRLKRFVVPIESQKDNESEKLWQHVTAAILNNDQVEATEEKAVLEEAQRLDAKERKEKNLEWEPKYFHLDALTGQWVYNYADLRPWDNRNDLKQYEYEYQILTKTRHRAPMVRTASIISSNAIILPGEAGKRGETKSIVRFSKDRNRQSESSIESFNDDKTIGKLIMAINNLNKTIDEHSTKLDNIESSINRMTLLSRSTHDNVNYNLTKSTMVKTLMYVFLGFIISFLVKWLFK